jgi:hypothetical protein
MTNKQWILTPEEDPVTGELIISFPEDFLAETGWKEGDIINWQDNKDGSFTLSKKDAIIEATPEEEEAWQLLEAQQKSLTKPKE